ncbi:MAG TPA: hypothetical protein VI381_01600, partial [Allosphingosinicella sp.]
MGRNAAFAAASLLALIGISASQSSAKEGAQAAAPAGKPVIKAQAALPVEAMETPAERALAQRISAIGASFNGDIGIAVKDVQTGYVTSYDGSTFFPQQSV